MGKDPWLRSFHHGHAHELTQALAQQGECSLLASIPSPFAKAFRCPGTTGLLQALLAWAPLRNTLDTPDEHGRRAVWWALGLQRLEDLKALLKAGADPHQPNAQGLSPIEFSAWAGEAQAVEALAAAGAVPHSFDHPRGTLELALESRDEPTFCFLLNGPLSALERPSAGGRDLVEQAYQGGLPACGQALLDARSKARAQARAVALEAALPFVSHDPLPARL